MLCKLIQEAHKVFLKNPSNLISFVEYNKKHVTNPDFLCSSQHQPRVITQSMF